VAALFTTGFLAGAISALFVGSLADRYGRRTACLAYCVITALSLFSVLSDNVKVLFAGRVLGGLSTTLMYTVFEAWMVTEYHQRNLEHSGLKIGTIFGRMITLSGISAIVAGVVGEYLVEFTRTKTAPFMASAVCMGAAFTIIWKEWVRRTLLV
jgi:MFS family permease